MLINLGQTVALINLIKIPVMIMIRTGLGETSIEFNSGHQLNWQLYLIKTPVTIIIGTGLGVGETSIEFNSCRQLWQLYVVVHGTIMKTFHNYLTISYTLLPMWRLWKHSIYLPDYRIPFINPLTWIWKIRLTCVFW